MLNLFKLEKVIGGEIAYYRLVDWWLETFSKEERDYIEKIYKPFGSKPDRKPLTEGHMGASSQTAAGLLCALAGWFYKDTDRYIAKKFIQKAHDLALVGSDILDLHFTLQQKMEIYYRERDSDPKNLETAVKACEDQLNIAPQVSKAFLKEYPTQPLPAHAGYMQLAIILKKQCNFNGVIEICERAKSQGWAGDWDKRIDEAKKKL